MMPLPGRLLWFVAGATAAYLAVVELLKRRILPASR